MEEALHDVPLFREFAGLEGWDERLPDESTIFGFAMRWSSTSWHCRSFTLTLCALNRHAPSGKQHFGKTALCHTSKPSDLG